MRIRFMFGMVFMAACGAAFAHSGKVDAKGCHANDKGVIHCHGSPLELQAGASSSVVVVDVSKADVASDDGNYANCKAVRDAVAAPLSRGDAGYSKRLDPDGDGIACE